MAIALLVVVTIAFGMLVRGAFAVADAAEIRAFAHPEMSGVAFASDEVLRLTLDRGRCALAHQDSAGDGQGDAAG
jgi:hypothetical protein